MDLGAKIEGKAAYKKRLKGFALSRREHEKFIKYMEYWLGQEVKRKIKGLGKYDE